MVERTVRAVLHEIMGEEPSDAELTLDSFAVVDLVQALEARFGFRVKPADVVRDNFRSVDAIVAFVAANVSR